MTDMQGAVWWGPAPHKSDAAYRPWLVVSDTSYPSAVEEWILVGMTPQDRPRRATDRTKTRARSNPKRVQIKNISTENTERWYRNA
ncbi:hypothetical protein CP557_14230 [Natrinema ejinorense]|uniref:Uncharacterized protein n=1 Tax=Natrinema ejinorense TaxID=373386 RepID=A0A2A5QXL3_9EURY|nr:hypothetical protein CP557_14230 [Natrinema ejinorense]